MTTQNDGGPGYWDRQAQRYDLSMLLFGKPLPRAQALVREAVRDTGLVLEVAAGTGLFSREIAQVARRLVATDYSASMIAQLRARVAASGLTNVECLEADIYALPFDPGRFNAVVAANVLHLVPDLTGAIAALRRVLRAGGKLITPTFCHDETRISRVVSHTMTKVVRFPANRRFTATSLRSALEAEGLKVVRQETLRGLIPISYLEGVF